MAVYFDAENRAYGFPIEGYVATVDDVTWSKYSKYPLGMAWNISGGQFVKLFDEDELADLAVQAAKRAERRDALEIADWMVERASDERELFGNPSKDYGALVSYRQYLRDMTKVARWWDMPVKTFDDWVKSGGLVR